MSGYGLRRLMRMRCRTSPRPPRRLPVRVLVLERDDDVVVHRDLADEEPRRLVLGLAPLGPYEHAPVRLLLEPVHEELGALRLAAGELAPIVGRAPRHVDHVDRPADLDVAVDDLLSDVIVVLVELVPETELLEVRV